MNSNVSVELWLHPDKLSALQAALEREHSTLRDHLQSSLEELYRIWVPHGQRAELLPSADRVVSGGLSGTLHI